MEFTEALQLINNIGNHEIVAETIGSDFDNEAPTSIKKRVINYAIKLEKNILTPASNYKRFYELIDGKKIEDISQATGLVKTRLYYYINNKADQVPDEVINKLKKI